MTVPIGRVGEVVRGDSPCRFIMIQDDREGSTGGFYILHSPEADFDGAGEGYDDWVLPDELEAFFEHAGWEIEWQEPGEELGLRRP
jgi:hypothetical protein